MSDTRSETADAVARLRVQISRLRGIRTAAGDRLRVPHRIAAMLKAARGGAAIPQGR